MKRENLDKIDIEKEYIKTLNEKEKKIYLRKKKGNKKSG